MSRKPCHLALSIAILIFVVLNLKNLAEEETPFADARVANNATQAVENNQVERTRYELETNQSQASDDYTIGTTSHKASSPPANTRPHRTIPRFLWGIFTMLDSSSEEKRREAVRDTYLSYYKTIRSNATRGFICSLDELMNPEIDTEDCYMIYAFVVGASPNRTTHLMDDDATVPMVVDNRDHRLGADGMVYLNIKENMNEGKSESWLKYAASLHERQQIDIDYIVKTDTDTLVFPDRFFRWVEEESVFPSPNNTMVYGGYPYRGKKCGNCDHLLVGSSFMGGELYFMSPDLAQAITSPTFDRKSVWVEGEDMAVGNYVYSYANASGTTILQKKIGEPATHSIASHPMKDVGRMRKNYDKRRGWR